MRDSLLFTTVAAVIFSSALAAGESTENLRTIATSGGATVYVVPDEAIVTIGVQTADPKLDAAKAANDEAARKIVQGVKSFGIEEKHLATGHLQVALRYTHDNTSITAYVVTRTYMVTVKDIKKVEPLVDSALNNGANQLEGVQFQSVELRKHRDKARSMAIKAAKEKVVALAKELDCTVGSPRSISESGGESYWASNRNSYFNATSQNSIQSAPAVAEEGSDTLPLGQIAIQATVSVTFDLVPAASPQL